MPEFIMDREGVVNGMTFDDLSDIFQGYIECVLFTETCSGISMVDWHDEANQERVREGEADGSIPTDSGWGDIHPDSAIAAQMEVLDFEAKARHLLSMAYARGYDAKQAGRDFWYTRNGHGVGFWARDELDRDELGEQLSIIARAFPTRNAWFSEVEEEESPTGYGFVYIE
jgi:hypothetical protein